MRIAALFLCVQLTIAFSCRSVWADEPVTPGLHTNIEYAEAGGETLTLDAFVPEGSGPFPTCILVHGGGFTKGDKQSYIKPLFKSLSEAGLTWFTINYRLAPQHQWPACADDVETAIRWVKAHASEYKVDVQHIALIGESAGGHLVSYVGALGKPETAVAAVVPFYAPHDLVFQCEKRQMLGPSMVALFGLQDLDDHAREVLKAASPSHLIHPGMPPYLLIHGDADQQVPYQQSVRFQQAMQNIGNRCDLITIPGGGHGMGGWDKLNSNYRTEMIQWLKKIFADRR